jgi:hypothetical protein
MVDESLLVLGVSVAALVVFPSVNQYSHPGAD